MCKKKKKVLFFLSSTVGGAERITITIAKMLPREDYNVKFVVVGKTNGDIMHFIPIEYETHLLYIRNMWDFLILRLISLLKKEKPYAVFSTAMHLNSRLILATRNIGGIKTVIRNCNYMHTLRWDMMALVKLTYHKADWIISQQEEMEHEIVSVLPKVDPRKVITLHNPLDLSSIEEKSKADNPYPKTDSVNYLWVARFRRTKGQDILAKAFAEVAKRNPKAHLWFVGKSDGADDFVEEVKGIIKENRCESRTHFVGFDANPYRWMKYCDCFVLPSRIEGLPNSLIEAQYLGRPCVAAVCIPVIDRIIQEGVNGYKVQTEDYHAMADAMVKAVDLKNVKMSFQSASKDDFIKLFE